MSLGWTSDTVNAHVDALGKTLEMKAHSEKFMNVSDMQVPDEDERMIVMMSSLAAKRSKRTTRL